MDSTVFISYSSRDIKTVNKLVDAIRAQSLDYWKAPEMIPTGSNYAREIPKALKNCGAVLLVISANSQSSIWVEKEMDMAINCHKPIVPIVIDETPLSDTYLFYLNNVQMIYYLEDKEKAKMMMINNLKETLGMKKVKAHEPILGTQYKPLFEEFAKNDEDEDVIIGYSHNRRNAKFHSTESTASIMRHNAMTDNKVPVCCEYCAGRVKNEGSGSFRCLVCGKISYDYFHKVKNYLEQVGSASVTAIHLATGVPRKTINLFFEEELLEIAHSSIFKARCSNCGKEIRTGVMCEKCKSLR